MNNRKKGEKTMLTYHAGHSCSICHLNAFWDNIKRCNLLKMQGKI